MSLQPEPVAYRWEEEYLPAVLGLLNGEGGQLLLLLPSQSSAGDAAAFHGIVETLHKCVAPNAIREVQLKRTTYDGFSAVELRVRRGESKPYFDARAGMVQGTWLWQGGALRLATEPELQQMICASDGPSYEAQRAADQALSLSELQAVLHKNGQPFGRPQLLTLGLMGAHGLYTNLAGILSDQRRYRLELYWIEGRQPIGRLMERVCLQASFLQIPLQLWNELDRLNRKRAEKKRKPAVGPDFSRQAMSEVVLLLMLMMDYSVDEPLVFRLYEDRMELCAPGGPPTGTDYADLLRGQSPFRNANLSAVLERINGSNGMSLSLPGYSRLYRRMPQLLKTEYDGVRLRITVPNENAKKPLKEQVNYATLSARAMMLLGGRDTLEKGQLAKEWQMTSKRVAYLLNHMARDGLLIGKQGGETFRPSDKIYFPNKPATLPARLHCIPCPEIPLPIGNLKYGG